MEILGYGYVYRCPRGKIVTTLQGAESRRNAGFFAFLALVTRFEGRYGPAPQKSWVFACNVMRGDGARTGPPVIIGAANPIRERVYRPPMVRHLGLSLGGEGRSES